MTSSAMLAVTAQGAGGSPLWQLFVLSLVYWGGTGVVLALIWGHRSGRTRVLTRAGAAAGWVFRLPGWSALPVLLATVGLLGAMWSGMWDIAYHLDRGRDSGPLGNPGHVPLLLGIFLTFAAGLLALGMPDERDASRAWVRITRGWRAPLGGVLLTGCMGFAMAALVLDDLWHRVFGQDVTLWSPTHFIYLCGGVLTVIGMLVLITEGATARRRVLAAANGHSNGDDPWTRTELGLRGSPLLRVEVFRGRERAERMGRVARTVQRAALMGGLLCGMELFLAEFDYGAPLYRQVWQPLLLTAFSAFIFIGARAWLGRGGALAAWAVYALVRFTAIVITFVTGATTSAMPLMLGAALCVELLAFGLDPRRRPLAFAAAAGGACGTVGFAAEYAWTQVAMPLPWTAALLPEGPLAATAAGVGAGLLGALFAAAMRGRLPAPRAARLACVAGFALVLIAAVDAGVKRVPEMRAQVELTDVRGAPQREALATVRIEPAAAAEGANWLYVLAWQGQEPRIVDRLRSVGEGVYRSNRPIPLHGTWKVGLRFNRGYERGAVPMRLPVDPALPGSTQTIPSSLTEDQLTEAMRRSAGAELPAPASFTRPFVDDNLIVLRETKGDVPRWLWGAAIGLTGVLWALFTAGLVLGMGRMGRLSGMAAGSPPASPGDRLPVSEKVAAGV